MNFCVRHYEEPTADTCRTCRNGYCSRCLVYAFGPAKPPYCVGCALAASGVRANRQQLVVHQAPEPRRLSRAERKAEKAARKLAAKHAKAAVPAADHQPLTDGPVPVPPTYTGQGGNRELYEQSA